MSIATLKYVRCDECGSPAQPGDDAHEARGIAKVQGFVREQGRDLCVVCSGQAVDYNPHHRKRNSSQVKTEGQGNVRLVGPI